MKKISLIHGPNINLTGNREPGIYGRDSLAAINEDVVRKCEASGWQCVVFQSNSEGAIIDRIHEAIDNCDGIIINAGAYTHYSYAIMDALGILSIPVVEVHMSNVHAREEFRHHSVLSTVSAGSITGFGVDSYLLGLRAACSLLERKDA